MVSKSKSDAALITSPHLTSFLFVWSNVWAKSLIDVSMSGI